MGKRKTIDYAKAVSVSGVMPYVVDIYPRNSMPLQDDMKRDLARWCNANVGELMEDWRVTLGERVKTMARSRVNPQFQVWSPDWHRKLRYWFKDENHAMLFKLTWSEYATFSAAEESF